MGDSHAEHWLPAVDRIGKRARHWKVLAMVKPACPVADMPELVNATTQTRATPSARVASRDASRGSSRYIRRGDSLELRSLHARRRQALGLASHADELARGLRRTYSLLSRRGHQHRRDSRMPQPGFDVPACFSRRASVRRFSFVIATYDRDESFSPAAIAAQNEAARGLERIAFVDMNDRFCRARRARSRIRGVDRLSRRRPSHGDIQSAPSPHPGSKDSGGHERGEKHAPLAPPDYPPTLDEACRGAQVQVR